jgi:hypothetical protein
MEIYKSNYFLRRSMKKELGILIVIIGIVFLIPGINITGNVIGTGIGETTGKIVNSVIGLVLIIGGLVVFIFNGKKGMFERVSLDNIIREHISDKNSVFVLDSSGAVDYQNEIDDLLDNYSGKVFVPQEVLKELKPNKRLYNKLKKKAVIIENSGYKQASRKKLELTPKHQMYLAMRDLIERRDIKMSRRKREKIDTEAADVFGYLKEQHKAPTSENFMKYIEKHYKVGEGDVGVFSAAINLARKRKNVNLLAHDTHIRDALKDIKGSKRTKKIADQMNYIDYREYSPA